MLVGSKCDGSLTFNFLFCCCSSAWVNNSATEECLNLYFCGLSTQKSRVSRVSVEELSGVDGLMKSIECKLAIKLVVRDNFILVSFGAENHTLYSTAISRHHRGWFREGEFNQEISTDLQGLTSHLIKFPIEQKANVYRRIIYLKISIGDGNYDEDDIWIPQFIG